MHFINALSVSPHKGNNQPQFAGIRKLYDAHGHLQTSKFEDPNLRFYEDDLRPETLINVFDKLKKHHVLAAFISNLDGIVTRGRTPGEAPQMDEATANLAILKIAQKDQRIKALFVAQPGRGGDPQKARELFEQAKKAGTPFYGIKFHPYYLNLAPTDPSYEPYMKIAREFKVPVVIHTDPGVSNPKYSAALAKQYPDVPIVLYHINLTGWPQQEIEAKGLTSDPEKQQLFETHMRNNFREAAEIVKAAGKNTNLYLECSWGRPHIVAEIAKLVGPDRMLFGTDMPLGPLTVPKNYAETVDKLVEELKTAGFSSYQIRKIFKDNTEKLFLKEKA